MGIQRLADWIPTFVGMTINGFVVGDKERPGGDLALMRKLRSYWTPVQPASAAQSNATAVTAVKPRRVRRRGEGTHALEWLVSVISGTRPSSCIARCVDVPGSTPDCNMRGLPSRTPLGLACGTHNALAVQSLQETPEAVARHH